jgi:hypothetical protein
VFPSLGIFFPPSGQHRSTMRERMGMSLSFGRTVQSEEFRVAKQGKHSEGSMTFWMLSPEFFFPSFFTFHFSFS